MQTAHRPADGLDDGDGCDRGAGGVHRNVHRAARLRPSEVQPALQQRRLVLPVLSLPRFQRPVPLRNRQPHRLPAAAEIPPLRCHWPLARVAPPPVLQQPRVPPLALLQSLSMPQRRTLPARSLRLRPLQVRQLRWSSPLRQQSPPRCLPHRSRHWWYRPTQARHQKHPMKRLSVRPLLPVRPPAAGWTTIHAIAERTQDRGEIFARRSR